jgi:hypothetical protein
MRSDFILPALLAVALAAMVGYAVTANQHSKLNVSALPIACEAQAITAVIGELREASGLAASVTTPQLFWSHNDSAEPFVYGMDATGQLRARVRIAGASVTDWEALTTARCESGPCLFVGDIGDNNRERPGVTIYRVREPAATETVSAEAVPIRATYPQGPQDAEAMFIVDGSLYIVTKGDNVPVRLYRLPSIAGGGAQTLQLVTSLTDAPADPALRITDAAVSPDGRWIALRSNDAIFFYDTQSLVSGVKVAPRVFDVRALQEPQGEGVAWVDDHTLVLAGEGEKGGTLARVTCRL